jgi:hypothetical protein
MRFGLAAACALLMLLLSAAAVADELPEEMPESAEQTIKLGKLNGHPAECSRLRRQIDQFALMQKRAKALENELWQARLKDHLDLLHGVQAARCPSDVPVDTTGEAFKQLLKLAAKAAITYFTFGAAGF